MVGLVLVMIFVKKNKKWVAGREKGRSIPRPGWERTRRDEWDANGAGTLNGWLGAGLEDRASSLNCKRVSDGFSFGVTDRDGDGKCGGAGRIRKKSKKSG